MLKFKKMMVSIPKDPDISYSHEKWKDISPVIVIFITKHDVLNYGLAIYHIQHTVKETAEDFHNESEVIYILLNNLIN